MLLSCFKNKGIKLTAIEKNNYHIFILIAVSFLFASCSKHTETPVIKDQIKIEKCTDQNVTAVIPLRPIERCKKENNRYNLIVEAPFGSIVRIMNIIPKYKDCISLKKGRYHIEVINDGFKPYNKWISLNEDTNMEVKLEKLEKIGRTEVEKIKLEKAGYNKKKLQSFMKTYPNSLMAHTAKKRINRIERSFKNYSPIGLIRSSGCTGFYPKNLVEKMLNIKTSLNYWKSVRWSGSCKNELMYGRGVLYFDSNKGVHVELKGKMKNGFFEGKVYNSSSSKEKPKYIKKTGNGHFSVNLNNRYDFIKYQK